MRIPWLSKPPRVYVDAKILNVHDMRLDREAYVGFVVEGAKEGCVRKLTEDEINRIGRVESDDAEILAIEFAIEKLQSSLKQFTIVCDHESVVSEANRSEEPKNQGELMHELRSELEAHRGAIALEVLTSNPAHGVVTAFVNRQKAENLSSRVSQAPVE